MKGTPNKISAAVKDNVVEVFDRLEGVDGMTEWARENQSEFYRLYAKLLPTDINMNVTRDARELEDDELNRIAAGSGSGVAEAQGSTPEPSALH